MQIVIRTDASARIGSGHVMRCLTLADRLAQDGAEVRFVCREHPGHMIDLVESKGFAVIRLPCPQEDDSLQGYTAWLGVSQRDDVAQTVQGLSGTAADWLVVDHYALDAQWEAQMCQHAARLLVIDDLANRRHYCDVLLDQNLVADIEHRYDHLLDSNTIRLLGPSFALLQPNYAALAATRAAPGKAVPRVLIFMGGADRGTTLKAVQGVLGINRPDIKCDVVLSRANPDFPEIERLVANSPHIQIHGPLPSLAPLMAQATLAVGAGGATSWERLCLGLRAVVVILEDNQQAVTEELERCGFVRVAGEAASVTPDDLQRAIQLELEKGLSALHTDIVDGRGAERVAAVLTVDQNTPTYLRPARAEDEQLLLTWANDKLVRANAFDPRPIAPQDHHRWLSSRLADPTNCRLLVAETSSGIPLGQVRFDRRDQAWVIDYSVAPQFRGRGLGKAILQAAIGQMKPGETIVGEVLANNLASHKVFQSLGFAGMPGQQGSTRYEISR